MSHFQLSCWPFHCLPPQAPGHTMAGGKRKQKPLQVAMPACGVSHAQYLESEVPVLGVIRDIRASTWSQPCQYLELAMHFKHLFHQSREVYMSQWRPVRPYINEFGLHRPSNPISLSHFHLFQEGSCIAQPSTLLSIPSHYLLPNW